MPKLNSKNVKYEEAFQKFSEAMASTDSEYNLLKSQVEVNRKNLQQHEGMDPCNFDSDFEGGNLDMAAKTF
jgi:hypothetical protein